MRVNSRVFNECMDMLDGIRIPSCPIQFRRVAENIMNMAARPGYDVGDYYTMTELDKKIMLDYLTEYDSMPLSTDIRVWFVQINTTAPELIRRARQWLSKHNYLILKPDVVERAQEAGLNFGRAIRH